MKIKTYWYGIEFVPENEIDKELLIELYNVSEISEDETYEGGDISFDKDSLVIQR